MSVSLKINTESKRSWLEFMLFNYSDHLISHSLSQHIDKSKLDEFIYSSLSPLKNDKTTTVVEHEFGANAVVIKRYNARNLKHRFTRAVRRSRAKRCWDMSFEFARMGLNVAKPVMMYEQRFGPLRFDAYFVNEKLSGTELLTALPLMTQAQKKQVVDQINDAFTKMQKAKITHGDMKATNLMWVEGQLYFIDLDASKYHRSMASFTRANNKDKKRFLKNWQDEPELLALFTELV